MGFFDDEKQETLTPGIYAVKLTNCSLDETKEFPKISVEYKTQTGRLVWQNFVFKDTTKKWLAWQLGVIGAWQKAKETCQDDSNYSTVARACLDAIGTEINSYFEGEITNREYKGKTYADLKLNRKITAQEAKTVTQTKKAQEPTFDASQELPF